MNYINKLLICTLLFCTSQLYAQFIEHIRELNNQKRFKEALNLIDEEIKKNARKEDIYIAKADTYWYLYSLNIDTSDITINKAYEAIITANAINNNNKYFIDVVNKWYDIIYRKAGINLNSENFSKANEWFKKVIKLMEYKGINDESVFYYAGISAFNTADYSFMEQYFKKISETSENIKEINEMLLIYYNDTKQTSKVIDLLKIINSKRIFIDNEIIVSSVNYLTNKKQCQNHKLMQNLAEQYEKYKNVQLSISQYFYTCNDTNAAIQVLTKNINKFSTDTLILGQLAILHYNKGIFLLKVAKEVINKDQNNVETYRQLKNQYIEEIKKSIYYNEIAINNNLKSTKNIICLYESYKHLQRKEEMTNLAKKYPFLK